MSRRIIRRSADLIARQQQVKKLQQIRIRTLSNVQSFQMLFQPSCYIHLVMQNYVKKQLFKICKLAALRKLVYLTDVQVQNFGAFFVMHKKPIQNLWFHESYSDQKDFDLYVNPQIIKYEGQLTPVQQKCHSFPFMKCIVDRSNKILTSYTKITNLHDESAELPVVQNVSQTFTGFKSILFQHSMDHLKGKNFFTPNVSKGRLIFQQTGQLFPKTKFLLKQYNIRVKKYLQQNNTQSPEFKKLENDYKQRISKSFNQQSPAAQKHAKNMINNKI